MATPAQSIRIGKYVFRYDRWGIGAYLFPNIGVDRFVWTLSSPEDLKPILSVIKMVSQDRSLRGYKEALYETIASFGFKEARHVHRNNR